MSPQPSDKVNATIPSATSTTGDNTSATHGVAAAPDPPASASPFAHSHEAPVEAKSAKRSEKTMPAATWLGVIIAAAALIMAARALSLQGWAAKGQFHDSCRDDFEAGLRLSARCNSSLSAPILPPPTIFRRARIHRPHSLSDIWLLIFSLQGTSTFAVTITTAVVVTAFFRSHLKTRPRPIISLARCVPYGGSLCRFITDGRPSFEEPTIGGLQTRVSELEVLLDRTQDKYEAEIAELQAYYAESQERLLETQQRLKYFTDRQGSPFNGMNGSNISIEHYPKVHGEAVTDDGNELPILDDLAQEEPLGRSSTRSSEKSSLDTSCEAVAGGGGDGDDDDDESIMNVVRRVDNQSLFPDEPQHLDVVRSLDDRAFSSGEPHHLGRPASWSTAGQAVTIDRPSRLDHLGSYVSELQRAPPLALMVSGDKRAIADRMNTHSRHRRGMSRHYRVDGKE